MLFYCKALNYGLTFSILLLWKILHIVEFKIVKWIFAISILIHIEIPVCNEWRKYFFQNINSGYSFIIDEINRSLSIFGRETNSVNIFTLYLAFTFQRPSLEWQISLSIQWNSESYKIVYIKIFLLICSVFIIQ